MLETKQRGQRSVVKTVERSRLGERVAVKSSKGFAHDGEM